MNYATIKYCDIANGEGVRTSLFVSGCRRHCPNCFNAVAWDFNYGEPFTKEVRNKILESLALCAQRQGVVSEQDHLVLHRQPF